MELGIVIGIICGVICAIVASNKGRSGVGWFFIGFFFGLFGLIAVLICSNKKETEAQRVYIEQENRRLREQLRQEQIKAETFRSHTQRRLDAHDEKLGLDTRPDDHLLTGGMPAGGLLGYGQGMQGGQGQGGVPFAQQVAPAQAVAGWYYAIDGQTLGPVGSAQMVQMIQSRTVTGSTLVWIEGMNDWTPASRVPEFSSVCTV